MKVLIYGATGSQMKPLVGQLLKKGHTPRVVSRDATAAKAQFAPQVELVSGQLSDRASLVSASKGVDTVVFMLPAFIQQPENYRAYVDNAITAASESGVKSLIWNTSGRYPMPGEHRHSDQFMLSVHEQLKTHSIPFITIAPTTYMENLLGPWTLNRVSGGEIAYPVLPERKMGWIASKDVCSFISAAIDRPHLAGQLYRVSGLEAPTGPELAVIFSEVVGRAFRYRTLSPQEMKEALEAAFGAGAGDEVSHEYALDQADINPSLKHYDMTEVLKDLPIQMTSLRQWIEEHRVHYE